MLMVTTVMIHAQKVSWSAATSTAAFSANRNATWPFDGAALAFRPTGLAVLAAEDWAAEGSLTLVGIGAAFLDLLSSAPPLSVLSASDAVEEFALGFRERLRLSGFFRPRGLGFELRTGLGCKGSICVCFDSALSLGDDVLDEGVVDLDVDFLGVRPLEIPPKPSCCCGRGEVTGVFERYFSLRAATLSRNRESTSPTFAPEPVRAAACFFSTKGVRSSAVGLDGLELPLVSWASLMRRKRPWFKSARALLLPPAPCWRIESFCTYVNIAIKERSQKLRPHLKKQHIYLIYFKGAARYTLGGSGW
jgi:hypothetical protein